MSFSPRTIGGLFALLLVLCSLLFVNHVKAQPTTEACLDELLLRWNQLAKDSNHHMQTVEVNPEKHRKAHETIDREYAAVKALACY